VGPGDEAWDKQEILRNEETLKSNCGSYVRIGDGESHITHESINRLLQEISPHQEITLIVQAHGNVVDGQHTIDIGGNNEMVSDGLFGLVSSKLEGQKIDVLFMPCYGGAAAKNIKSILPVGSKFVSLSKGDEVIAGPDVNRTFENLKKLNNTSCFSIDELFFTYLMKGLENRMTPSVVFPEYTGSLDKMLETCVNNQTPADQGIFTFLNKFQKSESKNRKIFKSMSQAHTIYDIPALDYGPSLAMCYLKNIGIPEESSADSIFTRRNNMRSLDVASDHEESTQAEKRLPYSNGYLLLSSQALLGLNSVKNDIGFLTSFMKEIIDPLLNLKNFAEKNRLIADIERRFAGDAAAIFVESCKIHESYNLKETGLLKEFLNLVADKKYMNSESLRKSGDLIKLLRLQEAYTEALLVSDIRLMRLDKSELSFLGKSLLPNPSQHSIAMSMLNSAADGSEAKKFFNRNNYTFDYNEFINSFWKSKDNIELLTKEIQCAVPKLQKVAIGFNVLLGVGLLGSGFKIAHAENKVFTAADEVGRISFGALGAHLGLKALSSGTSVKCFAWPRGTAACITTMLGSTLAADKVYDAITHSIIPNAHASPVTSDYKSYLNTESSLIDSLDFMQERTDLFASSGFVLQHLEKSLNTPIKLKYLYRGDSRGPRDIFLDGFEPRGTNTDLIKHAFGDGKSAFVATAETFNIAKHHPYWPTTERTYVYQINPQANTIDVVSKLETSLIKGLIHEDDYHTICRYKDMAIPRKIEPRDIKGVWPFKIKIWQSTGEPHTPSYSRFLEDYIPEIHGRGTEYLHNAYVREKAGPFIKNPGYRPPDYSAQLLWNGIKIFGYSLMGVGVGLDAKNLFQEFQISHLSGDYNNTYREATRIASGWVGATAVGKRGAKSGITVCAKIAPPYGSAACGFTVGLAGAVVGYQGSGRLATKGFDARRNINWSAIFKASGSALEASAGVILTLGTGGTGAAFGGGTLFVHGMDGILTAAKEVWSGRPEKTLTWQMLAPMSGATVADAFDTSLSLFGCGAFIKKVGTSKPVIKMISAAPPVKAPKLKSVKDLSREVLELNRMPKTMSMEEILKLNSHQLIQFFSKMKNKSGLFAASFFPMPSPNVVIVPKSDSLSAKSSSKLLKNSITLCLEDSSVLQKRKYTLSSNTTKNKKEFKFPQVSLKTSAPLVASTIVLGSNNSTRTPHTSRLFNNTVTVALQNTSRVTDRSMTSISSSSSPKLFKTTVATALQNTSRVINRSTTSVMSGSSTTFQASSQVNKNRGFKR